MTKNMASVALCLAHNYQTMLEGLSKEERSSLFTSDREKSFVTLQAGFNIIRLVCSSLILQQNNSWMFF
jgi:hypothetical protein